MIESIHIKSFKSIRDVTIELGALNVFIGPNGSGKSNFLEAVGLLSVAASGEVENTLLGNRGVRLTRPAMYRCLLEGAEPGETILLEAKSPECQYNVNLIGSSTDQKWTYHTERFYRKPLKHHTLPGAGKTINLQRKTLSDIFSFALPDEKGLGPFLATQARQGDPILQFQNILKNYLIYTPTTKSLRRLDKEEQLHFPLDLNGRGLDHALRDCTIPEISSERSALIDDFFELIDWASQFQYYGDFPGDLQNKPPEERISIIQSTPVDLVFLDRYCARISNRVSTKTASEGALLILFLACVLAHPEVPAFCAVDNADFGLNPRLVRELFLKMSRWAIQLNGRKQLLLTTHSPMVLDGLMLQDPQVRLFTVDRNNKGETEISRVIVDKDAYRSNKPLSQLWTEGYLGGVPNI